MIAFEQLLPMLLFTDQKIIVILFAVLLPPFLKYISDKVKCRYLVKYKLTLDEVNSSALGRFLVQNKVPIVAGISDRSITISRRIDHITEFYWNNNFFKLEVLAPSKDRGFYATIILVGKNMDVIQNLLAYCNLHYPNTIRNMNGHLLRYSWDARFYQWMSNSIDVCPSFANIFIEKEKKNMIRELIENMHVPSIAAIPNSIKILLYGMPGTGKTSIANAIANHYNRPIYVIDIARADSDIFMNIPPNVVIVFNDIDRFKIFCKETTETVTATISLDKETTVSKLSTTDLMNLLDQASNGWIIVLTTNHIDKIDPTVIRSCRIDLEMDIGLPSWDVVNEMFMAQFGEKFNEGGSELCPATTAKILAKVLTKKATYEDAKIKMAKLVGGDVLSNR